MRAKLQLESVTKYENSEVLKFRAVSAKNYPAGGSDENNSYAKWTPTASLEMSVTNKDLHGKYTPGQQFYIDFTLAE